MRALNLFLPAALLFVPTLAAAAPEADPVPTNDSPLPAVVNASRLNVRLRPDSTAPVLGQVRRDSRLVARGIAAGWCEIDYPAGLFVWIGRALVRTERDPPALADFGAAPVKGVVRRSGARLRSAPTLTGAIVGERSRGDEVTVVGAAGDWLRVVPPADLRAYVSSRYVELLSQAKAVEHPESPHAWPAMRDTSAASQLPPAATSRIELAAELLEPAAGASLEETLRALRLLDEALELDRLTVAELKAVDARVREIVGGLAPSRLLDLFKKVEARGGKPEEGSDSTKPITDDGSVANNAKIANDAPVENDARGEFTASGVLGEPEEGSDLYRLTRDDGSACEIDARGADLSMFVGKAVRVTGERRASDVEGGVPVVEARCGEDMGAGGEGQ